MSQVAPCPRCASARLSVLYFDSEGRPIGGHLHCPDCGPRHSERLEPAGAARTSDPLLERKAS